jgi:hypothetical protein
MAKFITKSDLFKLNKIHSKQLQKLLNDFIKSALSFSTALMVAEI